MLGTLPPHVKHSQPSYLTGCQQACGLLALQLSPSVPAGTYMVHHGDQQYLKGDSVMPWLALSHGHRSTPHEWISIFLQPYTGAAETAVHLSWAFHARECVHILQKQEHGKFWEVFIPELELSGFQLSICIAKLLPVAKRPNKASGDATTGDSIYLSCCWHYWG